MGLRIIYGKSGSGKSEYVYKEIKENIKEDKKIFLITPEQFSFVAEQKLMEKLNQEAVIQCEVIHLSRMAQRVIDEIGNNYPSISKSSKSMLISYIFSKNKEKLKYLSKSEDNIDLAISTITEFKKHGITLEKLNEQIENIEDRYLKTKLEDVKIIYENYYEKISEKYLDEIDKLEILAQNISNIDWLKDSYIYIDEFSGFTYPEYQVIKELIKYAKQVNITITTDELFITDNADKDIFYANKVTVKKLKDIIYENNLKEEKPVFLGCLHRFKNNELKIIEENLFKVKVKKVEDDAKNISIFLAKNQYTEIENVAREITKEVRDKKLRYKDISIITKNVESYANLATVIFQKYNIPIFIDQKRELSQNIIIQYILSILEILRKNYSRESIFQYLKIGFTNISIEDIFKLENYCIKWGINKNKFKQDFIYEKDTKKEEINYFNEIRKNIIEPLEELRQNIRKQKTAKDITFKLYEFLEKQNFEQKVLFKISKLENENMLELVQEYKESYQIVINILDEIVDIFGEEKLTIEQYFQIIKQGLKSSSLGKIPGTQDQVIMGDIDRSRSHKVKSIYIIGLNDGVYPNVITTEGFFGDDERKYLKEQGIELAKGTLENLYDDNFNIYKAFTTAENIIHLSYSSSDTEGKTLRPSLYINKIKKMFPNIVEKSDVVESVYEVSNKNATYEMLLEKISKLKESNLIDDVWKNVYFYFNSNKEWNKVLNLDVKGLDYTNLPKTIEKETIQKLYGNILVTSVSKLEKYRKCPFSYFLKYGLNLKPKEELKIQSFDTGSFMHEVIDIFFTQVMEKNIGLTNYLDEENILIEVKEIIENKLDYEKYRFTATVKFKILLKRLEKIISKSLKYIIESLVFSDFKVQGTEIEFGIGKEYKPIILELEDNKRVEIIGKIDRMDLAKTVDGKYLRIIDYKSSAKNIDLNEVYAGVQIQLLTYLDAISEDDMIPAGILYFTLLDKMIKTKSDLDFEEIEEKIREEFRMKGLILADINVIKMQDSNLKEGQSSKIIPAVLKKSGEISKRGTNAISKEEFDILQKYINKLIKQIGNEIMKGKIDLKPCNYRGKTPCEYCEYHSICGFDTRNNQNKYEYIENLSKDDIIKKMR